MTDQTNSPATAPALLTISSVVPDSAPAGKMLLVARWKSTDKRTIPATNQRRCVELPANIWTDAINNGTDSKSFLVFVHDAIEELARKYLSTIVESDNWLRTQVNEPAFSLSALLAWNEEQAALSGRLNGDTIKEWVSQSATVAAVSATHGAKVGAAIGEQFVKLAGPNHGLTPEKADKLLTNLWKAEDADSMTGLKVMLRLQAIRDKPANSDNVLDSIL